MATQDQQIILTTTSTLHIFSSPPHNLPATPCCQLSRIFCLAIKSLSSSVTCARNTAIRQPPPCTLQETHPLLRVCLGRSETRSTATFSPQPTTYSLNRDGPSDINSATATYLVTHCRQSSLFVTDRTMALRKPPHAFLLRIST